MTSRRSLQQGLSTGLVVKKRSRDTQRMHGAQRGDLARQVIQVLGQGEGAGQHLAGPRVVPRPQRQRPQAAEHLRQQPQLSTRPGRSAMAVRGTKCIWTRYMGTQGVCAVSFVLSETTTSDICCLLL